eukprot:TRINITY_DN71603_c0_g1_i1.p1 TRINITY_DN71603_c0_g1~~TRINITY_DN71603_c0_g1_i1.p1  ORF type:complete len:574 (-),score=130.76 TRINITY_DN71603_c0_g1_i1:29-1750(-)
MEEEASPLVLPEAAATASPPRTWRRFAAGLAAASAAGALLLSRAPVRRGPQSAGGGDWDGLLVLDDAGLLVKTDIGWTGGPDCFESGVEYEGAALAEPTAESAQQCQSLCAANAQCEFFTWDSAPLSGVCRLLASVEASRSWGDRISGRRRCPEAPVNIAAVPAEEGLATLGFCNGSMPLSPPVTPRKFDLPAWVTEWCTSDSLRPKGTWNWPGRNWCWVRTKNHACYSPGSKDSSTLPNWWWAQEAVNRSSHAPHPNDVLLEGLEDPVLCDIPEHARPLVGVSYQERAAAAAWVRENIAIFTVNLPSAVDRWTKLRDRFHALGLQVMRIPGVDLTKPGAFQRAKETGTIPAVWNYTKARLNMDELFRFSDHFAAAGYLDQEGIGTVGCAAAHLRAQKLAAKLASGFAKPKPLALILEDDVLVADDFAVKLRRLLAEETPCDWQVLALTTRCDYGRCISPHLSRVEPDGNEPDERCHNGVNFGMYAMLYRVSEIATVNTALANVVWNDDKAGCLPVDIAMSSISDKVAYYSVPSSQGHSMIFEPNSAWGKSNRRDMNGADALDKALTKKKPST